MVIGRPTEGVLWADRRLLEWLALGVATGLRVRSVRESTDARTLDATGRAAYHPTDAGGVLTPVDVRVVGRNPIVVAEPVLDNRRVFLVGTEVIGAPEDRFVPAVRALGRLAEVTLLECHFARRQAGAREWVLCGATAFPAEMPGDVVGTIAAMLGRAASEAS
jgi:hypothetical protein